MMMDKSVGAALIAQERERQVNVEGWTPEHDAEHTDGVLVDAARAYALAVLTPGYDRGNPPVGWPWDEGWWKPSDDPVRNLVKAGALIAAEIDRRRRAWEVG
jgi:hypothetical protein